MDIKEHHTKHYKKHKKSQKNILISLIFTLIFAFLEFFGGIFTNSLALLSDSFHMLSDVFALFFSLVAVVFSKKKPNQTFTFGYIRLEVIVSFVNGLALILISFYIVISGVIRIFSPKDIDIKYLITIGFIGLIFNLIVFLILYLSFIKEKNLGVESALLNCIGDTINSFGVIFSGIIIYYTDLKIFDVITSLVISVILFRSGYKITKKSFIILMHGSTVDSKKVRESILNLEHVINIHELHIWNTDAEEINMTMHVVLDDYGKNNGFLVLNKINEMVKKEYNIEHTTIQLDHIKYNL